MTDGAKLFIFGTLVGLGIGTNLTFALLLSNPAYIFGAIAAVLAIPGGYRFFSAALNKEGE